MSPPRPPSTDLAHAYAYCERLARAHYENFPVASRLLPAAMRPHIAAIYAFARLADDMADEGRRPDTARIQDLERWGARLDRAIAGDADDGPHGEVFVALRHTIEACLLPVPLFHDLLSAFAQDVTVRRYATWDDVLDYCRRSANPVGRLVLRVAGRDRDALDGASDAVCTALQLTNFWQDLRIDWDRGRLYVPAAVWRAHGATEDGLRGDRLPDEWRRAMREAIEYTRALFDRGREVCDAVPGRLKYELRATWLGGARILDKLEELHYDPYVRRPALSWRDAPGLVWRAIVWPQDSRG
ncbi:MAG TPA: squalene synthase HpnC [Vicinamibacterales bacterium]|nr:squalene synthase HpnC [Vicinamibacterales bacterium]